MLRACEVPLVRTWGLATDRAAVLGAGVNSFGAAGANTGLFGQAVARTTWELLIGSGSRSPANADLSLEHLDDVVLRITHRAVARQSVTESISTECLADVY